MLTRVLSYLNDLKLSLVANKKSYENDYSIELNQNQEILAGYTEKLVNLINVEIPEIETAIETTIGNRELINPIFS